LDRVAAIRAQTFNGHDRFILQRPHRRLTRSDGQSFHVHGAGAAEARAAAESSTGQAQVVPEVPEQGHVRVAIERPVGSVHLEIDHGWRSLCGSALSHEAVPYDDANQSSV
jgi:hypothetical protein